MALWRLSDHGAVFHLFSKTFQLSCEYAIECALSCSFCEYPFIFHCLHCSPSCFDPDSLLLAYLWLGLSWIDCISANKTFSSSRTSSRKPYTSSKRQERHKHSVEITMNFSRGLDEAVLFIDLDFVVGETYPGHLEPPDPAHFGSGPSGLLPRFPVGQVQQGLQKGADALGVQVLRCKKPLGRVKVSQQVKNSQLGELSFFTVQIH